MLASVSITLALLAGATVARHHLPEVNRRSGTARDVFWQRKVLVDAPHAVVVAGDSRGYRGVAPEVLADGLGVPPEDVLNFCFSGAAFEPRYLSRVDELVRREPPGRILLTLTPGSLTPEAAARNGFLSRERAYGRMRDDVIARARFAVESPFRSLAQTWFRPLSRNDWRRILPGQTARTVGRRGRELRVERFMPTGWVATVAEPPDPEFYFDHFDEKFTDNQVDAAAVARLMDRVAGWTAGGIDVSGVRMPIGDGLAWREDRLSGMDWDAFVEAFRAAGGTWIELDWSRFRTYDGSHLDAGSARRATAVIAAVMAEDRR